MLENDKKKLCWNCEGNVSLEQEICPYCRASIVPSIDDGQEANVHLEEEETQGDKGSFIATTMGLLMGGTFFFIFGLLLFFFSNNGYFVLRWSDSYWFLYLCVALPMIYFGVLNLKKL